MKLENIIESQQFTREILNSLFLDAESIRSNPEEYSDRLKGKILATLFYEPSTRTRLSFESAMMRLGGNVISTENAREFSSAIKGESIEDSIRVIADYADCIVMRHYEEGSATKASKFSNKPIINAGDGKGQHPTQALLDAYTINREIGGLDGLNIALVGDLASGRTVRSLCYLLGKFQNNFITFISPENLRIGEDIKRYLEKHRVRFTEMDYLEPVIPTSDIVYMTRIQKERISIEDYEMARGKFNIGERELGMMQSNSRLLHPLPHTDEIKLSPETEQRDARVAYFRQSENGLYSRMALLLNMLSNK
jgi:aspartate carbamoyltransferase catalytic subunit